MHMRPLTHDTTTKGESTKPASSANVEGEYTKAAERSKKAVETKISPAEQKELSQKEREAIEDLARSAVLTKSMTPKAKAKGVVIQEGVSKSVPKRKEVDQESAKRKGKEILIETKT